MYALDRKLLRDLWGIKGQALAICLVMACGVAMFVMSLSTLRSLRGALARYYDRYRFADVFASLKRAPASLKMRIAEIPGVASVQTRVVVNVTLDVPGMREPAMGRILSIPDRYLPDLNDLYLRQGRRPEPGRTGEVLVAESFATAHALQPGDSLTAVIHGRRQKLRIVGIALSPEYVYPIREGEMIPDNHRFAILWMGYTDLAAAFDLQGAFNHVSLSLSPGASEREVLRLLDRLLEPHGGLGAHGRAEQLSNKFLVNEMNQLEGMVLITPAIFLFVSAFLLNVVLTRTINTQREQIAALKAFGYTSGEIGWHYLKFVLVLVALASLLGTLAGARFGYGLTIMYTDFFRFPVFEYQLDPDVLFRAIAVTSLAAVVGALTAVRRAVVLPPAEALRPEPPATYRPTILERLGLRRFFSTTLRMILRHLEREPIKTTLSGLGIALAIAVLILGNCTADSVDSLLDFQFFASQRQDVTVGLTEPTSGKVLHELRHLPGVWYVEPFRSVPVRIRHEHRYRRLAVMGLPQQPQLFRLVDASGEVLRLPDEGLMVSAKLAEVLHLRLGDSVSLEILEGERPIRSVVLTALIHDFAEPAAYMNLPALHRLLREGHTVSGAFLAADSAHLTDLYARLKQTPRVASVNIKRAALDSFQKILDENLLRMKSFMVGFASIIAFGVVYNCARISLAERSRDLATLRVLGFTRQEISAILLGELAVLTLAAILPGIVLGHAFSFLAMLSLQTEFQRLPMVIYPATDAFAVTVTLLAALLSGLVVRRRLDELDLVAVLKARE